MKNKVINIGVLDDDESKITHLKGRFMHNYTNEDFHDNELEFTSKLLEQYNSYSFKFTVLELNKQTSSNSIISEINQNNIDCLIIDYKLNSFASTPLTNGVILSKKILENFYKFPLFILTSYEEELNQKEVFSPIHIIDYIAFLRSKSYSLIIISKIIETVKAYNKDKIEIENTLKILLNIPPEKRTSEIDSKILELDSQLERRICGKSAIPYKTKKELSSNKLDQLLNILESLAKKCDNNGK